ncbi:MAG: YraN family protein [Clostridia bacterium]|nr:YraN family protein [Clostridia bacterium]
MTRLSERIKNKKNAPLPPPPSGDDRAALGRWGEEAAARRLVEEGYTILGRNCRRNGHEVDILARVGAELVFCEVKTRSERAGVEPFCPPGRLVSPRQRRHLRTAASGALSPEDERRIRFDVVEVVVRRSDDGEPDVEIRHLTDAFRS